MKPRIAVVLGDPAGIGPELVARLISDPANRERADFLIIADRAELEEGMRIAGERFDYTLTTDPRAHDHAPDTVPGTPVLWDYSGAASAPFERAVATANGGRYALDTLQQAIDLTVDGVTDAVCFAPLNKHSMHLAGLAHADETHWFAELLQPNGPFGELNTLDGLWTSRVTSHVALKEVSDLITEEKILGAIRLASTTLLKAGVAEPRIAVCGLNPHNGDNGSFGREEIDVIGPAVEAARAQGFPVIGMYPADTIFLRAKEVDAIVTMYHDQGQIAMKLMGFSRGVTVHGGLPIPIATPAHGTAFDIYGEGKANVGATQAAFDILCAMAQTRRATPRAA
ncbi:4-hydroxythreonine-4-phosphate dehydrogenase PdxA [Ancylobacter sp. SL191]|uniref:4-hydroxythreonine-4-phosphate dehydrogenase PdxA n=1 Tax=Ancylobacter sp. SL191 TaxID=2995166 RepID=UPI00227081E4|nr:4-hydroxythreonine-4-phosphate dehydrogenase PdxA [Ancylobacter sp. SL191]WAC27578.1 4-hydroxythreonine-4-phosphate dehydrogenase PdxA [Ancylobacter sp. SL191]